MKGEKLGKYDIRGTLGRGAMGTVYEGWDPLTARTVPASKLRPGNAAAVRSRAAASPTAPTRAASACAGAHTQHFRPAGRGCARAAIH